MYCILVLEVWWCDFVQRNCLCYDPVVVDCSGKQLVHLPTFDKNVKESAVSLFLDKNNFKELLLSKEWTSLKEIYLRRNPFILCQSVDNMVKLGIKAIYDSCENNVDLKTANGSNPHVFTGTENSTLLWTSKKWTTETTRRLPLPVTKKWISEITRRLTLPVSQKVDQRNYKTFNFANDQNGNRSHDTRSSHPIHNKGFDKNWITSFKSDFFIYFVNHFTIDTDYSPIHLQKV